MVILICTTGTSMTLLPGGAFLLCYYVYKKNFRNDRNIKRVHLQDEAKLIKLSTCDEKGVVPIALKEEESKPTIVATLSVVSDIFEK